jgi:4-nitrophenyl phosphatase
MTTHAILSSARAFLLDGDGVLYRGLEPLPGAQSFIDTLNASGTPYLLLTNNAALTPQQLAAKMVPMRIAIDAEHIFTSAQATTLWLQERYPAGTRVLVVGEDGLRVALANGGFALVGDHRQAELVVAGLDRTATYAKLAEATLAIGRGCPFIGSNPDLSIPTERGVEPGAGAVLAFLQAATGVTPPMIGKPAAPFFHQAMARLGVQPDETVMVGDRYETDILGGHNAGIRTAAVLTGITSAAEFAAADPPPTWVFEDLQALLAAWQGVV